MLKRPSLLPALKWLMADSSRELMPALSPAFSWRAARTQARLDLPVLAAQSYTRDCEPFTPRQIRAAVVLGAKARAAGEKTAGASMA
jgi:hypothetical protein